MYGHTPGEWRLNPKNKLKDGSLEICSEMLLLAEICDEHTGLKQARANAQLMMSAKNLLETLEECFTDTRALAYMEPEKYAKRRFERINWLIAKAIEKTGAK